MDYSLYLCANLLSRYALIHGLNDLAGFVPSLTDINLLTRLAGSRCFYHISRQRDCRLALIRLAIQVAVMILGPRLLFAHRDLARAGMGVDQFGLRAHHIDRRYWFGTGNTARIRWFGREMPQ